MKNKRHRTGLIEAYRTSFKHFTLAAEQLQDLPSDPVARELALAEVEQARKAHSRSRDALVPGLLDSDVPTSVGEFPVKCEAATCCA